VNDYDDQAALLLSDAISAWRWAAAYGAYVPEGITVPSEVLVAAQCARQNYASLREASGRDYKEFLFDFNYYRTWDVAIAAGKVPVMDMMRVVIQDCQRNLGWVDWSAVRWFVAALARQSSEANASLDTLAAALRISAAKGCPLTNSARAILADAGVSPNIFSVRYWMLEAGESLSAGFSPAGKKAALGMALAEAILSE
jgi:hypothetical protein